MSRALEDLGDRCRDDLAVIIASGGADSSTLIDEADVPSFDASRGLLRRQ